MLCGRRPRHRIRFQLWSSASSDIQKSFDWGKDFGGEFATDVRGSLLITVLHGTNGNGGLLSSKPLALEHSLEKADKVLLQTFDEALRVGDTLTAKDVRARFDAEAQEPRKARSPGFVGLGPVGQLEHGTDAGLAEQRL